MKESLLSAIFRERHYTDAFLQDINDFRHPRLRNSDRFSKALYDAYQNQTHITLIGDFDTDGSEFITIAYSGLKTLGFEHVNIFYPDVTSGYGISVMDIDRLFQEYPDTELVITGDVGIKEYEGIARIHALGRSVIVTDHHPGRAMDIESVGALFVVDPNAAEDPYPHKSICGAMVIWELLHDYVEDYYVGNNVMLDKINRLLVFAGIATIADCMEISHESKMAVNFALSVMRYLYEFEMSLLPDSETPASYPYRDYIKAHLPIYADDDRYYQQCMDNLAHVIYLMAQNGMIHSKYDINEKVVSFILAPMINSVKRMGNKEDTKFSYNLFLSNADDTLEYFILPRLIQLNMERKDKTAKYMEFLHTSTAAGEQPFAPYIYLCNADGGLCGLLAANLLKETGMPSIVLSPDENSASASALSGSGRCPEWYPANDVLQVLINRTGAALGTVLGHNGAFGFRTNTNNLMLLYNVIHTSVQEILSRIPEEERTRKAHDIVVSNDGTQVFSTLDPAPLWQYLDDRLNFNGFGKGIEAPVLRFDVSGATISFMGDEKKHVRMETPDGTCILLWNATESILRYIYPFAGYNGDIDTFAMDPEVRKNKYTMKYGGYIHVYGDFGYNKYHGEESLNFICNGDFDMDENVVFEPFGNNQQEQVVVFS